MDTYVRSCAGYCVATYLLGVGDRHLDNIMICGDGHLFHIDFGFIFGRDPKPMPAPIRLTKEMIDGMGGPEHANYQKFKVLCCEAYNILRRSTTLFTTLVSLMRDAGISDLHPDPVSLVHCAAGRSTTMPRAPIYPPPANPPPPPPLCRTISKMHDKFRVDISDADADAVLLRIIDDSVAALFPQFLEVLHKIRVAFR